MSGLEELYKEIILDHYRNPRHQGELECPPAHKTEGFNPLCGDEVSLTFLIEEDSIAEGWQDFANCLGVDPDLFFPERGASTREAKEVCRGCVVRGDCLEYALQNSEKFGIWGGMSERERRRIRRQRALERQAAEQEAVIRIVPDSKAIS